MQDGGVDVQSHEWKIQGIRLVVQEACDYPPCIGATISMASPSFNAVWLWRLLGTKVPLMAIATSLPAKPSVSRSCAISSGAAQVLSCPLIVIFIVDAHKACVEVVFLARDMFAHAFTKEWGEQEAVAEEAVAGNHIAAHRDTREVVFVRWANSAVQGDDLRVAETRVQGVERAHELHGGAQGNVLVA